MPFIITVQPTVKKYKEFGSGVDRKTHIWSDLEDLALKSNLFVLEEGETKDYPPGRSIIIERPTNEIWKKIRDLGYKIKDNQ
jgi:hypothetical protein